MKITGNIISMNGMLVQVRFPAVPSDGWGTAYIGHTTVRIRKEITARAMKTIPYVFDFMYSISFL